nr:hypothetical protein [uncultured Noviherbaspirillum sp.]
MYLGLCCSLITVRVAVIGGTTGMAGAAMGIAGVVTGIASMKGETEASTVHRAALFVAAALAGKGTGGVDRGTGRGFVP